MGVPDMVVKITYPVFWLLKERYIGNSRNIYPKTIDLYDTSHPVYINGTKITIMNLSTYFDKVKKGTVFVVTHDNRDMIVSDLYPADKDKRWGWEFAIGENGRLVADKKALPGTSWIWSGSIYNACINNFKDYYNTQEGDRLYDKTKIDDSITARGALKNSQIRKDIWKKIKNGEKGYEGFIQFRIRGINKGENILFIPQPTMKVFLGMRFTGKQYNIAGRRLELQLPMTTWTDRITENDISHLPNSDNKLTTIKNATERNNITNKQADYNPLTMLFIDGNAQNPDEFSCDLLCRNYLEYRKPAYQHSDSDIRNEINDYLDKAIGIYFCRNNTFVGDGSGGFDPDSDIERRPTELAATEKMGLKVYAYLKIKVNGLDEKIYEIREGKIMPEDSNRKYDTVKKMENNQIKPGIQQFCVLLKQDTDVRNIYLQEVYCDGDLVYKRP